MQEIKVFVVGVGVALVLGGCAAKVLSSSPRSVVIRAFVDQTADAQRMADTECGKHGLKARINSRPNVDQLIFDCVQ